MALSAVGFLPYPGYSIRLSLTGNMVYSFEDESNCVSEYWLYRNIYLDPYYGTVQLIFPEFVLTETLCDQKHQNKGINYASKNSTVSNITQKYWYCVMWYDIMCYSTTCIGHPVAKIT